MSDWYNDLIDELGDDYLARLAEKKDAASLRQSLRVKFKKIAAKWKAEEPGQAEVTYMHLTEKGGLDVAFKTPVGQAIAQWVVETMEANNAPNFLTMSMNHEEAGMFDITLQRLGGVTPAQRLTQMRETLELVKEYLATNEWGATVLNDYDGRYIPACPECGGRDDVGHDVNCTMVKLMSKVEALARLEIDTNDDLVHRYVNFWVQDGQVVNEFVAELRK